MPLDTLQQRVLKALSANRSPENLFAGGSVLHRHGPRLSEDQDLFVSPEIDLERVARSDMDVLRREGFAVQVGKRFEGFVEAEVGTPDLGRTRVQWLAHSQEHFFAPVADPEYGWRLHYLDLATNKVQAAVTRREPRDFVDLCFVHETFLPLWHLAWAAAGKQSAFTPYGILDRLARNNNFSQAEMNSVLSLEPQDAGQVARAIQSAIDEARDVFPKLPQETAGRLLLRNGQPITAAATPVEMTLAPRSGPAWFSGPELDHAAIMAIREKFTSDPLAPGGAEQPPPMP